MAIILKLKVWTENNVVKSNIRDFHCYDKEMNEQEALVFNQELRNILRSMEDDLYELWLKEYDSFGDKKNMFGK